jgi:predicted phosphohydrolase
MLKIKIQYASDLHLEFNSHTSFDDLIKPTGDFLVLAGDIGNPYDKEYFNLLEYCSKNFKYTFIVTGNHEYFSSTIKGTDSQIEKLCSKFNNVIFLQKGTFKYRNIVFIGCSLWTYIPDENRKAVNDYITDHTYINRFDIDDRNLLHLEQKEWIENTIKNYKNCIKVLITHHPLVKVRGYNDATDCAFTNSYEDILKNFHYSICGHTHYNYNLDLESGCKVLSNCRGYRTARDYQNDKYIEIKI